MRVENFEQASLSEQHARAAVLQHEGESFRGIRRIERKVCSAGFEDAEQPDDHLDRTFGTDGNQRFRPDSRAQQRLSSGVRDGRPAL